jgi:3-phenylpropionate/trans-cinnamate dioxygenase ferredoxin subunit
MPTPIKVLSLSELPPGSVKGCLAGSERLVLCNAGGALYALEDHCPHAGALLSEGELANDRLLCPWHAAEFDLKTGAALRPPARRGVRCFPVSVREGGIWVEV